MSERRTAAGLAATALFEEPQASGYMNSAGLGVKGVAMPYGSSALISGAFEERFHPAAFAEQDADGFPDVELRFQHEDPILLASTRSGTLRISNGPNGLAYEADLPRSAYLEDIVTRGDLNGASVGFTSLDDVWEKNAGTDGRPLRTVRAAYLHEISLVGRPAYKGATASAAIVRPTLGRSRHGLRALDTSTITVREAALQVRHRQNQLARDERHRALMDEADFWIDLGKRR
jgi:uncharacterized protein